MILKMATSMSCLIEAMLEMHKKIQVGETDIPPNIKYTIEYMAKVRNRYIKFVSYSKSVSPIHNYLNT